MKRYRFRLDPVLRVRQSEEEAARGALLAATAAVRAEEQALADRTAAYAAALTSAPATTSAGLRAEHARRSAYGAAVLEQRRRLDHAHVAVSTARNAWSAAAARVGALERLDERQREEHRAASLKEDDLITDELVVSRHGRVRT